MTENTYAATAREVQGGIDLRITATDGHAIDAIGWDGEPTGEIVLHIRDRAAPRVGERVMVDGRLVKVADRRYGHGGQLMLLDEDTRVWAVAR